MSEDLVLRYKDNNSQRTPCVLVLDGSKSMDGQPIDELNRGLKVLEQELKEDVVARARVRVLIIRVGGMPSVLGDWTDAIELTAPTLEASGNTPLGEAMELALQSVAEEKQRLDEAGISSTRPWIFMISDGAPTDPGWQAAADNCVRAEQAQRVAVFPIGVSGADLDALGRFSPRGAAQLDGLRFTDFFHWLSRSVSSASQSGPNEDVQLPAIDWARAPTRQLDDVGPVAMPPRTITAKPGTAFTGSSGPRASSASSPSPRSEQAMANLMPLVHQARRTIRNRQDGNPFATDAVIADLIEALSTAYLAAPNERVSRAIKVELDLLETPI